MELVKVNSNQSLVAQQLEDAIAIVETKTENYFSKRVKELSEAFKDGMLTVGEFVTQIEHLQAVHKKDKEDLLDAEQVLLALRNAQHMLSML